MQSNKNVITAKEHTATQKLYMYQKTKIRRKGTNMTQNEQYYKSFITDQDLNTGNRSKHIDKMKMSKHRRAQQKESPSRISYLSHDEMPQPSPDYVGKLIQM